MRTKKYVVTLTAGEQEYLKGLVTTGKSAAQRDSKARSAGEYIKSFLDDVLWHRLLFDSAL